MKIVELRAENVKRLTAVEVRPDGAMVIVGGKNGAGKSSVLDAIYYALAGAGVLPGKPVRDGAEKASIEVTLDGEQRLVVRRKISADGRTTLEIEQRNADGTKAKIASPQKLLDSLVGSMTFDPLAFTRLRPQEQVEALRQAVGVSVADLDAEERRLYDERTEANRAVTQLAAGVASLPAPSADTPDSELDLSALQDELDDARRANEVFAEAKREVSLATEDCQRVASYVAKAEADAIEAEQRAVGARNAVTSHQLMEQEKRAALDQRRHILSTLEEVDETAVFDKLRSVDATNALVRAKRQYQEKHSELDGARLRSKALGEQIDTVRADRIRRLAAAKWPVGGLSFGESGVTFNGLPFDQCSSAEQLRISTSIALSQGSKLRIGMIRDGSLLDADSLAMVASMAADADAQIWIERVGSGEECTVVIEDGAVVGEVAAVGA